MGRHLLGSPASCRKSLGEESVRNKTVGGWGWMKHLELQRGVDLARAPQTGGKHNHTCQRLASSLHLHYEVIPGPPEWSCGSTAVCLQAALHRAAAGSFETCKPEHGVSPAENLSNAS